MNRKIVRLAIGAGVLAAVSTGAILVMRGTGSPAANAADVQPPNLAVRAPAPATSSASPATKSATATTGSSLLDRTTRASSTPAKPAEVEPKSTASLTPVNRYASPAPSTNPYADSKAATPAVNPYASASEDRYADRYGSPTAPPPTSYPSAAPNGPTPEAFPSGSTATLTPVSNAPPMATLSVVTEGAPLAAEPPGAASVPGATSAAVDVAPPAAEQPLASTATVSPPPAQSASAVDSRYSSDLNQGFAAAAPAPLAAETAEELAPAPSNAFATSQPKPLDYDAQPANDPYAASARETSMPTGGEGSGEPGNAEWEGPQTPSLSIDKLAPSNVQVNKPAVFEARIRNVGNVAAHNVSVRDEVPRGTRLLSTNPQATPDASGFLVWNLGDIPAGEEVAVQMEVMPTAEGELGSVATVTFAASASVRAVATRPQLTIDVDAPEQVLIGGDVTFTIRVSNPGTGSATNVLLTERVPENLEHPAGAEIEYTIEELQPGETRELSLTMKAVRAGVSQNLLVATGDAQLQAQNDLKFEVTAPQLAIRLDGPKRRYLERPATYTVEVSNPGTAPARDVQLVTYLPDGLDFVEANNAGQYDPQTRTVHWLLEELPAMERGEVSLTTMPVQAGDQAIKVKSIAQQGLQAEQEESVLVEGVVALLFQLADLADPIELGGETTYEIRVVNQGSKAAENVKVAIELPPQLQAVDADGPSSHSIQGQTVVFEGLPRLAPKADTTYHVKVKALAVGDLRIKAQVFTEEITPVTKEESTRVYADE